MKIFELRHLAESRRQLAREVSVSDIEPQDPVFGVERNTAPLRRIRSLVPVDGVGSIKKLPQFFPIEFSGVDLWGPNLCFSQIGRLSRGIGTTTSQECPTGKKIHLAGVSTSLYGIFFFVTESCLSWGDPIFFSLRLPKLRSKKKRTQESTHHHLNSRFQFPPSEIPSVSCRPHQYD